MNKSASIRTPISTERFNAARKKGLDERAASDPHGIKMLARERIARVRAEIVSARSQAYLDSIISLEKLQTDHNGQFHSLECLCRHAGAIAAGIGSAEPVKIQCGDERRELGQTDRVQFLESDIIALAGAARVKAIYQAEGINGDPYESFFLRTHAIEVLARECGKLQGSAPSRSASAPAAAVNQSLWDQYCQMVKQGDHARATAFWRENKNKIFRDESRKD